MDGSALVCKSNDKLRNSRSERRTAGANRGARQVNGLVSETKGNKAGDTGKKKKRVRRRMSSGGGELSACTTVHGERSVVCR